MPKIRTRVSAFLRRRQAPLGFRTGNAGDIFARNIVDHVYGVSHRRVEGEGKRLLPIGSIVDHSHSGDVFAGVGARRPEVPASDELRIHVRGVRGPGTLNVLSEAGHDISRIQSVGDPGLLISEMVPPQQPEAGRVLLVPHFRDRQRFRALRPRWLTIVDIDADPMDIGRAIASAEAVVTSSLHGLVFAHALDRPCLLVQPSTENEFKYRDHLEAVGVAWTEPVQDIRSVRPRDIPSEPAVLRLSAGDLDFPAFSELLGLGVVEPDPVG